MASLCYSGILLLLLFVAARSSLMIQNDDDHDDEHDSDHDGDHDDDDHHNTEVHFDHRDGVSDGNDETREKTDAHRDATQKSTKAPHIVMVIMDDLGSHDLGLHGTGISTPTCDELAATGVYLDNYYVLPSCSPTRSAILSGRYPLHTGINNFIAKRSNIGLGLDEEVLPQVLRRAGYATHAVGKWHVGHASWEQTPTFRGFDSFFGFYSGAEDYYTHQDPHPYQGIYAYDFRRDDRPRCGANCSQVLTDETIVGNYSAFLFAQEATHILSQHDQNQPLFLYLAFQSVHFPTEAPFKYWKMYQNRTDWSRQRQVYAGMLTAADEALGQVVDALQSLDMWQDTLLVFSTDNGGPTETCAVQGSSNGAIKRGGKCTVWQGGTTGDGFLAGPALGTLGIARPRSTPAIGEPTKTTAAPQEPRRFQPLFHCVDWLPTLAAVAGVEPSGRFPLDGVNQLSSLRSDGSTGAIPAREEVYIGVSDEALGKAYGPALRFQNWKLIQGNSGGDPDGRNSTAANCTHFLLFDLSIDPGETVNLATQYPHVVDELNDKLEAYKATGVPQATEDPSCPWKGFVDFPGVGPTYVPWCDARTTQELVVYSTS